MANGPIDKNGNVHDGNGQFVSLRSYIEAILSEKEKQTEFSRAQLERALVEARVTTERAMQEARLTVEQRLVEAKAAADEVAKGIVKRLDNLESGGAPFASRLDDGLKQLKADVDLLKEGAIKQGTIDELRKQQAIEIASQRKQIRLVFIAAAVSFGFSLILIGVQLLGKP